MTTPTTTAPDRPDPLGRAVATAGPAPAALAALLTALLAAGFITQAGLSTITVVLGAATIAVTLIGSFLTARRVADTARADVTPTADPRDDTGAPLQPATDGQLADVLRQVTEHLTQLTAAAAGAPMQPPAPTPDQIATFRENVLRDPGGHPLPPHHTRDTTPQPPAQSPAYAEMLAAETRTRTGRRRRPDQP